MNQDDDYWQEQYEWDLACSRYEEEEEEYDEFPYADYAYEGFYPACQSVGCKHWGGDGLCMVAILHDAAQEDEEAKKQYEQLEDPYCSLQRP